ncbi:MAG: serine/threonine protein kinase [Deltaproteobacteria bacterium]|nr:serine/threonine protein kinase [Deltaproteobacteria bacterium]
MADVRKLCVVCSKVYRGDETTCSTDGTLLVIEAGSDSVELGDGATRLGHVLGNYRLQRVLGEGGAGTVYEAEHVRLGRKMAIKLLHSSIATPTAVQRFFNEARAVNEIRHPNIIEIEDFVSTPSGEHYLVIELLEGDDLRTVIRREGKLSAERVAAIGEQVASALAAIHAVNIVHRDLKPDNIFLARKDGVEVFKLLDFGVAKFTDQQGLTRAGTTMGTPQYMAPEMIVTGREKEIGPGSDIYALGMVMYEALTGAPAFSSTQIATILRAHCYEPVTKPSQMLGAPVPPVLEAAILKCLEKPREQRFASAGDLGSALRANLPVRLSGKVLVPRAAIRKARSRRRRVVAMMPAFAMAIAAVVLQLVPRSAAVAQAPARPAVVAPAPAPPPPVPESATITVKLASKPSGAELFMGPSRKSLGPAPVVMILPMSTELVQLVARFPDGSEVTQTVVPDRELPELIFEAARTTASKPTRPAVKPRPSTKPGKPSKPDDRDSMLDPFKR